MCEVNRLVLDIPDSFLQENQRHGDIFCADRMVIANKLLKEGFSAYLLIKTDICADVWTQQGSV